MFLRVVALSRSPSRVSTISSKTLPQELRIKLDVQENAAVLAALETCAALPVLRPSELSTLDFLATVFLTPSLATVSMISRNLPRLELR